MKKRTRAIIIKGEKILLIHRIKGNKEYWVFPGGGIESYDFDSKTALIRECKEELGVDVEVGDMFTFTENEFFYYCNIFYGQIGTGHGPEFQKGSLYKGEYVFEWVPLNKLAKYKLLPEEVKEKILLNPTR